MFTGETAVPHDIALLCYETGKYSEAVSWCDNVLRTAETQSPIQAAVKLCKAKALAQLHLFEQNHCLNTINYQEASDNDKNDAFDSRANGKQTMNRTGVVRQLSLSKVEELCTQALDVICLLGEVLDDNASDEEGSELLDWMIYVLQGL